MVVLKSSHAGMKEMPMNFCKHPRFSFAIFTLSSLFARREVLYRDFRFMPHVTKTTGEVNSRSVTLIAVSSANIPHKGVTGCREHEMVPGSHQIAQRSGAPANFLLPTAADGKNSSLDAGKRGCPGHLCL